MTFFLSCVMLLFLKDPDPSQVTVRSLVLNDFTFKLPTETFSLNVTWQKPSFNYSQIKSYAISYRVDNGKETRTQTVSS